jgi:hypothetical protein
MHTTFTVSVDQAPFAEASLEDEATFARIAPRLLELNEIAGAIHILHEGAPDLELRDDLPPLVLGLCFGAAPKIRAGEHAEVSFASYLGRVEFVPAGDMVRVTDDRGGEPRTYPADQLGRALIDCGRRFAAFIQRLYGDDKDRADVVQALEQAAAATTT